MTNASLEIMIVLVKVPSIDVKILWAPLNVNESRKIVPLAYPWLRMGNVAPFVGQGYNSIPEEIVQVAGNNWGTD